MAFDCSGRVATFPTKSDSCKNRALGWTMGEAAWLQEYHQQAWDKEIEDDLEAGRLDAMLAEVDKECEDGLARPR